MSKIRWRFFPRISDHHEARQWLELQANRQLSPRTVEAYGRGLEEWLRYCYASSPSIIPERATRIEMGQYVNDLAKRPGQHGPNVIYLDSGAGLSHQTIQLRLTAIRRKRSVSVRRSHIEMGDLRR